MLRRAVNRVEAQRPIAHIADIVTRPGWNDHREIRLDLILNAVDVDSSAAFLETEELVAMGMNLGSDLLARLQSHQHQLKVPTSVEHMAIVFILDRERFD